MITEIFPLKSAQLCDVILKIVANSRPNLVQRSKTDVGLVSRLGYGVCMRVGGGVVWGESNHSSQKGYLLHRLEAFENISENFPLCVRTHQICQVC